MRNKRTVTQCWKVYGEHNGKIKSFEIDKKHIHAEIIMHSYTI